MTSSRSQNRPEGLKHRLIRPVEVHFMYIEKSRHLFDSDDMPYPSNARVYKRAGVDTSMERLRACATLQYHHLIPRIDPG